MKQYLKLVKDIRQYGSKKGEARENMPHTTSHFGPQIEFDLKDGFPILTTKKVSFKAIKTELFWFLSGNTNVKFLVDRGVNVWNEDAYNYYIKHCKELVNGASWSLPEGHPVSFEQFVEKVKTHEEMGEMMNDITDYEWGDTGMQYGALWRKWPKAWDTADEDQLRTLLEGLRDNPLGRRHIITAWNPETIDLMALPACHSLVQFNVRELTLDQRLDLMRKNTRDGTVDYDNRHHKFLDYHNIPKYAIDCKMYQRSADVFLGVPFNIASYALFTMILAKLFNFEVGRFIHTFGDAHIYSNHEEQLDEQLTREPMQLPNIVFDDRIAWGNEGSIENGINNFLLCLQSQQEIDKLIAGITLDNYQSHAGIKGKLSTGLK